MKCEEFEQIGLGLSREGAMQNGAYAVQRAAAIEHANTCPRCAALQESWQEAQIELQALRAATQDAAAPARVEMRLRQEFRTRHHTVRARRIAVISAWTLAAAAVLLAAVSLRTWRTPQTPMEPSARSSIEDVRGTSADTTGATGANASNHGNDLIAANSTEDFTLLPGSLPQDAGEAAIVRVRMQRGALGTLGLPVSEERAGEWIQVDLLVGEDGQPQAVRLLQ